MISKNRIKFIHKLLQKKYRQSEKLLIVEGTKCVEELLLSSFSVHSIYAVEEWLEQHNIIPDDINFFTISESELRSISALTTPNDVLAIAKIPEQKSEQIFSGNILALDKIKDPGNLGTILRIADWFGIRNVIGSELCVDVYNPKVIQASMGSVFRVNYSEADLNETLMLLKKKYGYSVFGTFLGGKSVYETSFPNSSVIVLGSESTGISKETEKFIDERITIPSFSNGKIDSLNVAVSAGIICSELMRTR